MRRRGFTLIEVLFALGLFLLMIIPLLQTEMLSARSVNMVQARREGIAIATTRLDEVQHSTVVGDGTSTVDGYEVITSSSHVDGLPVPLTRVQVEVRQNDRTVAVLSSYHL